jgi:hypothetical protein
MPRKFDLKVIESLKHAALKAVKSGHTVESAIVIFQMVEGLLRIAINAFARDRHVPETMVAKCADEEQSFPRLVAYLTLLVPDSAPTEALLSLNTRRNKIVHRIYYDFESLESLRQELDSFCREAIQMNNTLQQLLLGPAETATR